MAENLELRKLLEDFEVEVCRLFLRETCEHTKNVRRKSSSYGLKHSVEQWSEARFGLSTYLYVSNDSFIAAAELEGYKKKPINKQSINFFFNIKVKDAIKKFIAKEQRTRWHATPESLFGEYAKIHSSDKISLPEFYDQYKIPQDFRRSQEIK